MREKKVKERIDRLEGWKEKGSHITIFIGQMGKKRGNRQSKTATPPVPAYSSEMHVLKKKKKNK